MDPSTIDKTRQWTTRLCPSCDRRLSVDVSDIDLKAYARSANVPLSFDETLAISSRAHDVRESLRECAAEVDRLAATLSALRQQRAALDEEDRFHASLFAPARKTPPEILAEIAAYTLPPHWFKSVIGLDTSIWPFSQVCHSWREAALSLRWPWARLRVPCPADGEAWEQTFMEMLGLYLKRSAQHPLTVKFLFNSRRDDWDFTSQLTLPMIWQHTGRLHALEVFCAEYDGFPFPPQLPLLVSLTIRDYGAGPLCVNAPNLKTFQLLGAKLSSISMPWANLRALKLFCGTIYANDIPALAQCTRLEVLSLMEDMKHSTGTVLFALETGPLLLEFPFLHTLEIARGAVGICHYIRAPLLRTFILDMFRYSSEGWANLREEHLPLITNIIGPATNITLYNMGSYPTLILHRIIKAPQRLERLTLVDETMPPRQTSIPPIHHGLMMNLIIFNEADPPFPHLTELQIVCGKKGVRWERDDVSILQQLLKCRCAPAGGCTPLARLSVQTPFAKFSGGRPWMETRGGNGQQILHVEGCDTRTPVKKSEPACFYEYS